jgi:hypothetical protein
VTDRQLTAARVRVFFNSQERRTHRQWAKIQQGEARREPCTLMVSVLRNGSDMNKLAMESLSIRVRRRRHHHRSRPPAHGDLSKTGPTKASSQLFAISSSLLRVQCLQPRRSNHRHAARYPLLSRLSATTQRFVRCALLEVRHRSPFIAQCRLPSHRGLFDEQDSRSKLSPRCVSLVDSLVGRNYGVLR